ncbi:MAG: flavodoxin [Odoribacter sp.]
MKKTGIFYGSTTGNTENVAEKIATALGIGKTDLYNVADTQPSTVQSYATLLLGCSTWGVGEMQDDWNDFLFKLKDMNLKDKTVALFGCGDGVSFSSSFCDALGLIYKELQHTGCTFIGKVDPSGFSFDNSEALIDGKFVGLPIDENNESDKTNERIQNWISQLKPQLV